MEEYSGKEFWEMVGEIHIWWIQLNTIGFLVAKDDLDTSQIQQLCLKDWERAKLILFWEIGESWKITVIYYLK